MKNFSSFSVVFGMFFNKSTKIGTCYHFKMRITSANASLEKRENVCCIYCQWRVDSLFVNINLLNEMSISSFSFWTLYNQVTNEYSIRFYVTG